MKKIYQKFLDEGLLREEKIGFDQIRKIFDRAERDIKSAKLLVKADDKEGAFRFAYESMLLSGRALVFSFGLKPRTVGSHRIVIDFAQGVLGKEYKLLVQKFNRMRKKRNYLIYGIGLAISETEARSAIDTAQKFLLKIKKFIQERNPQKELI